MELTIDEDILKAYGFTFQTVTLQQIGSGHINRTYLLSTFGDKKYILQNINTQVFKDPFALANNIESIADYLNKITPNTYSLLPLLL